MFIPGETISHHFVIPFVKGYINKAVVSYKQNDHIVLKKEVEQIWIDDHPDGSQFTVNLSQQESLLFKNGADLYVQVNVLLFDGTRCTSVEMRRESSSQHIREVVD